MTWLKYAPTLIEWFNSVTSNISSDEDYDVSNLLPNDFVYYIPIGIAAFILIVLVLTLLTWILQKLTLVLGKFVLFILAIAVAIVALRFVEKKIGVPVETYLEDLINGLFPS